MGITHPIYNLRPPFSLLKVIAFDATYQLVRGEAGLAFEDALAMIRFSDLFAQEPGLLPFVLRLGCLSQSMETVERGIGTRAWNAIEIDQLEQALARFSPWPEFTRALRGERAKDLHGLESLATEGFDQLSAEIYIDPPIFGGRWASGWLWRNLVVLSENYSKAMDLMSATSPLGERCNPER